MGDNLMCKCVTSKFSPHRVSKCALNKAKGALVGVGILGAGVAAGVAAASVFQDKSNKKEKDSTKHNDQSSQLPQSNELPENGVPLPIVENESDLDNSGNSEVLLRSDNRDSPTIFTGSEYVNLNADEIEKEASVDEITETLGNSLEIVDNKEIEDIKVNDSVWSNIGSCLLEESPKVKEEKIDVNVDQDSTDVGKNDIDEFLQDTKSLLRLQQEEIKILKAQNQYQQLLLSQEQARTTINNINNNNQQQSLPIQTPVFLFSTPTSTPTPYQTSTPSRSKYGITQKGTVCKNCIAIGGRCHWHR